MPEKVLTSRDISEVNEPLSAFAEWLKEAEASELNDPTAAALASVDSDGMPT